MKSTTKNKTVFGFFFFLSYIKFVACDIFRSFRWINIGWSFRFITLLESVWLRYMIPSILKYTQSNRSTMFTQKLWIYLIELIFVVGNFLILFWMYVIRSHESLVHSMCIFDSKRLYAHNTHFHSRYSIKTKYIPTKRKRKKKNER